MDAATDCNSVVLPALAGERMRPRCPLPMGATTSMTRPIRFVELVSSLSRSVGLIGVRLSKSTRSELDSGSELARKSVVMGQGVSVGVDLGCSRLIKKQTKQDIR